MKLHGRIYKLNLSFALFAFVVTFLLFGIINLLIQSYHADNIEIANKIKIIIEDEFNKNIFGLQGTKGFVLAKEFKFSPQDFSEYALSRDSFANFPAAMGFGFIRAVKGGEELAAYVNTNKSYFSIYPETNNQLNMIIEVVEPAQKNSKTLGLNVVFEESRKNAAMNAALTGQASLSDPITLVQREANEIGFLFFLPIYKSALTPPTEAERLRNLVGWAFAPIALQESFNKILAKMSFRSEVEVNVSGLARPLTFGKVDWVSKHSMFRVSRDVVIGGKNWKLSLIPDSTDLLIKISLVSISVLIILFLSLYFYRKILLEIRTSSLDSSNLKVNWADNIIENSALAIIATNEKGLITLFNPAAEALLGYKMKEMVGQKTPEVFHDKHEITLRAQILSGEKNKLIEPGFEVFISNIKKGFSETKDWICVSKSGEKIPVSLTVNMLSNQVGECIGFLQIVVDLRESKIMQELIEKQKVMMFASAKMIALGEMTSGIAHEINTPLAIIIGQCELMVDKLNANKTSPADLHNDINRVKDTAYHVAKVVKSMRKVSRDSSEDQLSKISLMEPIKNAIDLSQEKLKINNINLEIKSGTDQIINCRSSEISQVFLNLMNNSIDAIKNKKVRWIKIEVKETDDKLIINFIDSGLGIEPHVVEKMMGPFFTTKLAGQGTGLDLSISKAIIESHQGQFKYVGTGKNTHFQIELPNFR